MRPTVIAAIADVSRTRVWHDLRRAKRRCARAAECRRVVTNIEDLLSHQSVLDRSKSLVAAAAEVHRSFELGWASGEPRQSGSSWEAWRRATPRLHTAMDAMYPDPLWVEVKAALRRGERTACEAALVFLEVDPWCFRSGYEKADLMKGVAHLELSAGERLTSRR